MSQLISPMVSVNTTNISQNYKDDSFSEMKNYLIILEKNLKDKEIEISNLQIKISNLEQNKLIQTKELEKQNSLLIELTNSLEKLKDQNKQFQNKINELESDNRNLTYSNIELNQKNKSLNTIKESIKNNNNNNIISNSQFIELSNKLDEMEIIKKQLEFENTKLINRLNQLEIEYNEEIKLINKIKNSETQQLQKTISSLEKELNENIKKNTSIEKSKLLKEENQFSSHFIIEQISSFEKKIKNLNEEVFTLKKENKNMKNKLKENSIEIDYKDKIIQELKLKVNDSEAIFHQKINELTINNNGYIIEAKESQNEIGKLIYEKDKLIKENNELKNNIQKFNIRLKETNVLFEEKTKSFNNVLNLYNNKLNEYKGKIQQLKIKINELYKEKQEQSKKIDLLNEENNKFLKKQIIKNNNKNKVANSTTRSFLKKNIYNSFKNMNNNINGMNIHSKSLTEPSYISSNIINNDNFIIKAYNDIENNGNIISNDSKYISQNKILNDFKNVLNKVETLQKMDNLKLNKDDEI